MNKQKGNFEDLINDEKLVLLDFHATWCGPCKAQTPILEELHKQFKDELRVIKIDVDVNNELAAQLNIKSVPTLILFKNGKPEWKNTGKTSLVELSNVIRTTIR